MTGGLITAVLGLVMMPWKLMPTPGPTFHLVIGYSSRMGAIGGILIADYGCCAGRELSLRDLFDPNGRYAYTTASTAPR